MQLVLDSSPILPDFDTSFVSCWLADISNCDAFVFLFIPVALINAIGITFNDGFWGFYSEIKRMKTILNNIRGYLHVSHLGGSLAKLTEYEWISIGFRKDKSFNPLKLNDLFLWCGGAGGNWTRVQKTYILGTTCLVDYLFNQLDANRQASSWWAWYYFAVQPQACFPR